MTDEMEVRDGETGALNSILAAAARGYRDDSIEHNSQERSQLGNESNEYIDKMHGKGLKTLEFASGLQDKRDGLRNLTGREERATNKALSGVNWMMERNRLDNDFFKV
jgi:hypothetical protein